MDALERNARTLYPLLERRVRKYPPIASLTARHFRAERIPAPRAAPIAELWTPAPAGRGRRIRKAVPTAGSYACALTYRGTAYGVTQWAGVEGDDPDRHAVGVLCGFAWEPGLTASAVRKLLRGSVRLVAAAAPEWTFLMTRYEVPVLDSLPFRRTGWRYYQDPTPPRGASLPFAQPAPPPRPARKQRQLEIQRWYYKISR